MLLYGYGQGRGQGLEFGLGEELDLPYVNFDFNLYLFIGPANAPWWQDDKVKGDKDLQQL